MPTTQTTRRPPPLHMPEQPMQQWHLETQRANPLNNVDTSKGSYTESAPAAGLNPATGQTNQNAEITYIKISADANVFTLTGVQDGPYYLKARRDVIRIKSDGSVWWPVG